MLRTRPQGSTPRSRSGLVVLGLALAVSLSACAVDEDPGAWSPASTAVPTTAHDVEATTGDAVPSTDAPTASASSEALEWQTWVLGVAFFDGQGGEDQQPATLRFVDGTVEVVTGCNTGGGSYELEGDLLAMGPISSTMMACEGTVATVEQLVFGLLSQGQLRATITDGEYLTLTSTDGTALGFTRAGVTATGEPTTSAPPADTAPTTTAPPAPTGTAQPPAPTRTAQPPSASPTATP